MWGGGTGKQVKGQRVVPQEDFRFSVHLSWELLPTEWILPPPLHRELPFQKGDIVYIIRQVDQNWYEGEHHGRVGIFPQSYVEVRQPLPAPPSA